jgi:hypothetical protein
MHVVILDERSPASHHVFTGIVVRVSVQARWQR